jgi:RimJ/RimL family protein N-acetyltransferase
VDARIGAFCRDGIERKKSMPASSAKRLQLVPASPLLLRLELDDPDACAALLKANLPEDWPPGEYDHDAMQFFLERMLEGGESAAGWYSWYAILPGENGEPSDLVGCGGYFGPPDAAGSVEIGYSIAARWRGMGLAKELVRALLRQARQRGATRIVAHTSEENPASMAVLRHCRFQQIGREDSGMLCFECVAPFDSHGSTIAL